jgi:hypothetical protein
MKRSFFAGIIVIIDILKEANENEIVKTLDKIQDEIIEYLILNKLID